MARKYHPDLNRDNPKEAEENSEEVKWSLWSFIQSTEKAQYDHCHAAFDGTGGAMVALAVSACFGLRIGGRLWRYLWHVLCGGAGGSARRRGPERGSDLRQFFIPFPLKKLHLVKQ